MFSKIRHRALVAPVECSKVLGWGVLGSLSLFKGSTGPRPAWPGKFPRDFWALSFDRYLQCLGHIGGSKYPLGRRWGAQGTPRGVQGHGGGAAEGNWYSEAAVKRSPTFVFSKGPAPFREVANT